MWRITGGLHTHPDVVNVAHLCLLTSSFLRLRVGLYLQHTHTHMHMYTCTTLFMLCVRLHMIHLPQVGVSCILRCQVVDV